MSYNTRLQTNNNELDNILETINSLPEAGSGEPTLQDKRITPSESTQVVIADEGYDGLGVVTVDEIPDEYIVPSGTKTITKNGTHDVTANATVDVNVPIPEGYIIPSGTKNITENGTHDAKEYESVSVNVPIPEGYIVPSCKLKIIENGEYDVRDKAGVVISVKTQEPALQAKAVTPSIEQQTILPDTGYDGLSCVVVKASINAEEVAY